ncbi:2-hydroxyacid dehydrogenase [Nitrincola sp.]|uniref:2-hydroxyacid dehydrogenase n=1 Tax=Nitrincola sp. TaxID=1926584 RepID=UPI003A916695
MTPYLSHFQPYAGELSVFTQAMPHDPEKISFALLWQPDPDFFERYPNVHLVASIAAGVDNILACPSRPADLLVCRNRDPEQAAIMSTFAIWHLIGHQRNFMTYLEQQRRHQWLRQPMRAPSEVNVGVLGLGFMGERIARDCYALGFNVAGWRKQEKSTACSGVQVFHGEKQLQGFLQRTEVLICVLPLTHETQGILNAWLFQQLLPNAYLIHIGRGAHLNTEDLFNALEQGTLTGASIDVFTDEPLPANSPFWDHPNIIVTPHDASDVRPATAVNNLVDELRCYLQQQPLKNIVQPAIGY